MTEPVVVNFQVGGVAEVTRAFASITDRLEQIEKRGVSQRTRARRAENDAQERAFSKLAREADRWKREEIRSAEKAEKDKSRSVDRAAREQLRAIESSERQKERAFARTAREVERWEREATRTTEREAKKRAAAEASAAREKRQSFARAIGYGVRGGFSTAARVGTGLASTALQLGGGFTIADSMDKNVKAEGAAAQLVAGTTIKNRGGLTSRDVMSKARQIGISEGIGTQDAIEGIAKYKDLTGDLKDAVAIAPEVAKLATATGSSIEDLMSTAGNIRVADTSKKLSQKNILDLLKVQVAQGQEGSLEVKDMGKYGARLVGGAALVGGDQAQALKEVGALAQISKGGGATTAAEMTMAAQSFTGALANKSGKDGKIHGISTMKNGMVRSPAEVIQEMVKATNGDTNKLAHLGLGKQANKALFGAANIYNKAGGGAAGAQALEAELGKYTSGIAKDEEINAAHAERMAATDKQIEVSMQKLHEVVGTQLVPELVKLVPELSKAIPHFARFIQGVAQLAGAFSEHPIGVALAGLGTIMAATVTKEIVAAKIGEVIKGLLLGQPGGGGGAASAATGAAGGSKIGAYAGPLAVAATVSYLQGKEGYDAMSEGTASGQERAKQIHANIGKTGPEGERARAEAAAAKEDAGGIKSYLKLAANVGALSVNTTKSWVTGENESKEGIKKFFDAKAVVDSESIQKGIAEAVAQGAQQGMAASANDPKRNAPMVAGPRGGAQ